MHACSKSILTWCIHLCCSVSCVWGVFSVSMCVYLCVCMCVHCISVCVRACVYICVRACVYICVCACVYICVCACVYICVCACVYTVYLCVCMCVYLCVSVSFFILYALRCVCVCVYIHVLFMFVYECGCVQYIDLLLFPAYLQCSLEELKLDAEHVSNLVYSDPEFHGLLQNITPQGVVQGVAEAMEKLHEAPSPQGGNVPNVGLSPEGCMMVALGVQWLVRHLCKRLMQLMTPEALIVHRKKMDPSYLVNYLKHHSHFSLKVLIRDRLATLKHTTM